MSKKKTKACNKITPRISTEDKYVDFSDLQAGDCFLLYNNLWMRESGDQVAINLANGAYKCDLCGIQVIPVDIEIKWKEKKG